MVPGILVFEGFWKPWIFMTFRSCCKDSKNKQKSKRNHWKINLSTSAKQCISKEKFKQSLKVHTKCAKSVNKLRYVKILLRNRGGDPPQMQYFDISQFVHTFCTLSVYFWTCFELSLWNPLVFLGGRLIFHWFVNDFAGFSAYFLDILQRLRGSASGQKAGPHIFSLKKYIRCTWK